MPAVTISRPSRGRLGRPAKQEASITDFARVSKLQNAGKEVTGEKSASGLEIAPSSIGVAHGSRKRKADHPSESSPSPKATQKRTRRQGPEEPLPKQWELAFREIKIENRQEGTLPKSLSKYPSENVKQICQKRRRNSSTDPSAEAQAGALLERLQLQSPPRKRSRPLKSTARSGSDTVDLLPEELLSLSRLHAAFLKTLSLHYAHNGANAPADVRSICPSIAQSWGKRKVTLDDVRRCIGVLDWREPGMDSWTGPLTLSDYGRGKICVELDSNVEGGLLNEEQLNAVLDKNLRLLWSTCKESGVGSFITALPKAAVTTHVLSANPLISKGQRVMDEIKKDMAKKQEEKEAKAQQAERARNTDGPKMSLLDRIRCKEVEQSRASKPPSPEELQRRAALHRIDDVAGVIGMLSMATAAGRARISFTMPALLTKLKDSLRIPISQEEGTCCVRLLANEVMPQWLRVVKIGGKENVVVQTGFQPSKTAIQEKVKSLISA